VCALVDFSKSREKLYRSDGRGTKTKIHHYWFSRFFDYRQGSNVPVDAAKAVGVSSASGDCAYRLLGCHKYKSTVATKL
jgi:hypothetical protein